MGAEAPFEASWCGNTITSFLALRQASRRNVGIGRPAPADPNRVVRTSAAASTPETGSPQPRHSAGCLAASRRAASSSTSQAAVCWPKLSRTAASRRRDLTSAGRNAIGQVRPRSRAATVRWSQRRPFPFPWGDDTRARPLPGGGAARDPGRAPRLARRGRRLPELLRLEALVGRHNGFRETQRFRGSLQPSCHLSSASLDPPIRGLQNTKTRSRRPGFEFRVPLDRPLKSLEMVDPGEQYVNPDPEIGAAPIDLSGWAEPIERWRYDDHSNRTGAGRPWAGSAADGTTRPSRLGAEQRAVVGVSVDK
jgi:hypothetical protein